MGAPKGNKFAKGNEGGRPRKYEIDQLPELAIEMQEWFENHITNLEDNKDIPFLEQFARSRKISHDTLLSYCEDSKEFSVAYKECKEIQKQILITGGLKGYFNPSAFIFTAKNIAGMRDKTETDVTSGGEKLGVVILPAKNEDTLGTTD